MKLQRRKKKINGKKWFFEKIDKNDKRLARWNKVNAEKTQIADIKRQRGLGHGALGTGSLGGSRDKVTPLRSALSEADSLLKGWARNSSAKKNQVTEQPFTCE